MSHLAALIKRRTSIKGSLTKICNYAKKEGLVPTNQLDVEQLRVRLRRAEALLIDFQAVEQAIDEEDIKEPSHQDEFEETYYRAVSDLNKLVRKASMAAGNMSIDLNETVAETTRGSHLEVKLPKINIPPFSGNYTEWQSFYDLFASSIHENVNLNPAQKFQYLKGLLRNEAANLLRHLPISDANYIEALNKLKARYDRKRHAVQAFIKTLLELPSINNANSYQIRKIMDTADEVVRGLKAIGPEAETRDPWLIHLLLQKLDEESRERWSTETTNIEFPTCQILIDFLMKRADALDSVKGFGRRSTTAGKTSMMSHVLGEENQPMGSNKSPRTCVVCKEEFHLLYVCPSFKAWNLEQRKQFIKSEKRCFNCLSPGHSVYHCKSRSKCYICKRRHNSLLHDENQQPREKDTKGERSAEYLSDNLSRDTQYQSQQPSVSNKCLHSGHKFQSAILPTATLKVKDINGQYHFCRALLDSGSQNSFITEQLAQELGLERRRGKINIQGLAERKILTTRGIVDVIISPHFPSNFIAELSAYVVPVITTIKSIPTDASWLPCSCSSTNLSLADISSHHTSKIDLLIGADKFFDIMKTEQLKDANNRSYAQNTQFGWILTGNMPRSEELSQCNLASTDVECLDQTLRRFWETEEVFNPTPLLPEDGICEKLFMQTTTKQEDDHYMVKLPFKLEPGPITNSLSIAVKRFHTMEKRLNSNTNLRIEYVKFMEEYEQLKHMVEVEPPKSSNEFVYLPHHGVWKEASDTTKLRVVFDASAKSSSGYSLNDNLLVGPTLQNVLGDILIRFRLKRIVFTADAEKMYRQIWIHPSDRRYQRIVWRKSPEESIKHYELKTLTYGMSSAPYLANRVIKHIAETNSIQYPRESEVLAQDMYMDDLLTGASSVSDAVKLAGQLVSIMSESGFNLRKWYSNSAEFIKEMQITESNPAIIKPLDDESPGIKVLGLQWQPATDSFSYHVTLDNTVPTTKRSILSEASRIFDPLGLAAPFIIKIKSFFQALWMVDLGWDDELSPKLQSQWVMIRREIGDLSTLTIPRWLYVTEGEYQLHGFCDSSETAFAATVYLRTNYNGAYTSNLITARTKVAPIKNISLPRLELNGALLLVRLIKRIQQLLNIPEQQIFGWTDSTIVLDWLTEPPRRWKTYVANRTSEILEILPRSKWRHITSKMNPADCATRGLNPIELQNHILWWKGPTFLQLEPEQWPISKITKPITTPDRRENIHVMVVNCSQPSKSLVSQLLIDSSSYDKTIRILIYIRKFIALKCQGGKLTSTIFNRSEWIAAENIILRQAQTEYFSNDIQAIKKVGRVKQSSALKSLNPFIDSCGLLRVGGRIEKAIAPYDTIHPLILSAKSEAAKRIVSKYHLIHFHCGAALLMSVIRRKFWIIRAKDLIKKTIRNCVFCIKQRPKPDEQIMGNLPRERIQLIRPFLKVGVDFAGPIYTYPRRRRGQKAQKSYICCLVCLSTRAIHLEMVGDLTTEAFLNALYRFFARRGVSTDIYSDNGGNFRGASKKLKELNVFIKNNIDFISNSMLSKHQVTWHFIPPHAPHFGGIWEAGVKSAKTHMERVTGSKIITEEELHTLLVQIEGLLNSRPLCVLADDEIDPLTPAHFLIGHPITTIPQREVSEVPFNRLSHWNAIKKMKQLFWKRWYHEYVTSLSGRMKWTDPTENLKLNDVVLIKEENPLVGQWKVGRINQVYPGSDGYVRVAEIVTNTGVVRRPITKLCRLPIN